jgi:TolB-like protein
MQWFRATGLLIVLVAGVACAKTGSAVPTQAPPPETKVRLSGSGPKNDPRGCPPRDAARPDRRPTVAVMYFGISAATNSVDYEPLSKGIADMMVVSLSTNCDIRVVEREQLQRLLTEQNLSPDRMDGATRVRVGRLLGAQHMIMGSVTVLREQMAMTAYSVNVETSEHEADVVKRDAANNLLDVVPVLARDLNDKLKLPHMETPFFDLPRPPNRDDELTAIRLYSRALEEKDRGNKTKAMDLCRAALEKFPTYGPAQQALSKLQAGG